jgi:hypothetical protein
MYTGSGFRKASQLKSEERERENQLIKLFPAVVVCIFSRVTHGGFKKLAESCFVASFTSKGGYLCGNRKNSFNLQQNTGNVGRYSKQDRFQYFPASWIWIKFNF